MNASGNVKTWYGMIATVGGVGRFGRMPGTIGTFVAFLLLLLIGRVGVLPLAAVVVVGTLAADRYARAVAKDDPQEVVIDEVAGYWTSVFGLDATYAIVAFFLFRIVDILKPFPVRRLERLPGGIGIMADDICGGVLVNLIMRLATWLFFSNGFHIVRQYLGAGS